MDDTQEVVQILANLDALPDSPTDEQVLQATKGFRNVSVLVALYQAIQASGGGGGSGDVQLASVTLDHADLLDLTNNAVQVVPAPSAGSAIWPTSALLVADTTAAPYTVNANTTLQLGLNDGGSAYTLLTTVSELADTNTVTNILGVGAKAWAAVDLMEFSATAGTADNVAAFAQDPTPYDGQGLYIFQSNGLALIDGDAANTLTVHTLYTTITL